MLKFYFLETLISGFLHFQLIFKDSNEVYIVTRLLVLLFSVSFAANNPLRVGISIVLVGASDNKKN